MRKMTDRCSKFIQVAGFLNRIIIRVKAPATFVKNQVTIIKSGKHFDASQVWLNQSNHYLKPNNYMKAIQLLWTGLALALVFSACKKEKQPVPAAKLVAVAGPDPTVAVNATIQLDGTASREGNGWDFTYAWRFTSKPAGSQATLSGPATAKPTFILDVANAYVAALEIVNASGQSTDDVTITATAGTPGDPTAEIISADIMQDRHLTDVFADPARADYLVTADVKVGAQLSLAPEVVVAFEAGKGLMILPEGALVAKSDRPG
jgi:hypothetical protein